LGCIINRDDRDGFNCDKCIEQEKPNNVKGKICLIYNFEFEEDVLTYPIDKSRQDIGIINSWNDLNYGFNLMSENWKTDEIEHIFKLISNNKIQGLCPKSYQLLPRIRTLLGHVHLCLGGYSGMELVQLPYPGTILDQPNIFIQVYNIYVDEKCKFDEYMRKEEERKRDNEAKR
jgi:hypothetical protein